ncbi:cilia- and flagella-associated protein 43-like [Uloborus diversus]|uniref:cilia- and flagella-associated protein 43-like n=1 Tax=Uloborus diversus TaxID=327109 RepID=UPI0024095343|nr:cilia- and flagella-associated protein 43-like [Uloborus diversus]
MNHIAKNLETLLALHEKIDFCIRETDTEELSKLALSEPPEIKLDCKIPQENKSRPLKGVAEYFFDNDWLTEKHNVASEVKTPKVDEDQLVTLKKEANKTYTLINEIAQEYDTSYKKLVEQKLALDIELNKEELQLVLLLFSASNTLGIKMWEAFCKDEINFIEHIEKRYEEQISKIDSGISNLKYGTEELERELFLLNGKVHRLGKHKSGFLEAFDMRPRAEKKVKDSLDPYSSVELSSCSIDLSELDSGKYKPANVSNEVWNEMCELRRKKIGLENRIKSNSDKLEELWTERLRLKNAHEQLTANISERTDYLKQLHSKRIRSIYETPMVASIADPQLEIPYPDELNFQDAFLIKKFHLESLNNMITSAGKEKLEALQKSEKMTNQIEKSQFRLFVMDSELKAVTKDIQVIRNVPITKDVQKFVEDPRSFDMKQKIRALEKVTDLERNDLQKQIQLSKERTASVSNKMEILSKALNEKKKEIEVLRGNIAELRGLKNLTN